MSQRVTTIGSYLCWAAETEKGVRPTTGYEIIPEIKSFPDLNQEPESVESTTLLEPEYRTYEPGLKSLGTLSYGANMTDDLEDVVEGLIKAQDSAAAEGKRIWFAEVAPKLKKASFFAGKVSNINFSEFAVNEMGDTTLYITPTTGIRRYEKPTLTEDSNKLLQELAGEDVQTLSASSPVSVAKRNNNVEV